MTNIIPKLLEKQKFHNWMFLGTAILWGAMIFWGGSLGILPKFGFADEWGIFLFGIALFSMLENAWKDNHPEILKESTNLDWGLAYLSLLLAIGAFTVKPLAWYWVLLLVGVKLLMEGFQLKK